MTALQMGNNRKMKSKTPKPTHRTTVVPTRGTVFSTDYNKQMHELNHDDVNNDGNPFLYHFETGFDALCAKNGHLVNTILSGCQKIEEVRQRLNSKKGHFEEDEALNIWEQCFKYITEEVFPDYKEGNTDGMDHVWAMGVILAYITCGYPALKTSEDIKCYDNVGIGPEVKSIERERMIQDGRTFPAKKWSNLTPEAREHIKECIHYHPGNRPCMTYIWFNNWRKMTNEAIIETDRLEWYCRSKDDNEWYSTQEILPPIKEENINNKNTEKKCTKHKWDSFMNKARKQSKKKKRKVKEVTNRGEKSEQDENEWKIEKWLSLYEKRWNSPEDLEEYNNYPVPCGAWGRVKH